MFGKYERVYKREREWERKRDKKISVDKFFDREPAGSSCCKNSDIILINDNTIDKRNADE